MNISDMLNKLKVDIDILSESAETSAYYSMCFRSYKVEYDDSQYLVVVNVFTGDIENGSELPSKLYSMLFAYIRDYKFINFKTRVERRAFLDFLRMYYCEELCELYFIDRESPDFKVVLHNQTYSYEVVEATRDGAYRKMIYSNSGKGLSVQEYTKIIDKSFHKIGQNFDVKGYGNAVMLSPSKGLRNTSGNRAIIVQMILKKIERYRTYNDDSTEKNIIVLFDTVGYSNDCDFNEVSIDIKNTKEISNADIDRVFVVRGIEDRLVEYDKNGNFIVHSNNN